MAITVEIANFPHPGLFDVPAEGVPRGIGYRRLGSKKTMMMGIPGEKEV